MFTRNAKVQNLITKDEGTVELVNMFTDPATGEGYYTISVRAQDDTVKECDPRNFRKV